MLAGNASNPVLPLRALIYMGTFVALHLSRWPAASWWLRRALGRPSPIAVYLPIALLAAFSAGNGGSSVNYLIEPVVALALAVPFAWRALPADAAPPLLAALQLALLFHWPNGFGTAIWPRARSVTRRPPMTPRSARKLTTWCRAARAR